MTDGTAAFRYGEFGIGKEFVEEGVPIRYPDVFAALRPELGLLEEHDGDAVEGVDFFGVQIVLGGANVALSTIAPRLVL